MITPNKERTWRWQIGVASALLGVAGVLGGLREDLDTGLVIGLLVALAVGILLALRGIHHRIEPHEARRSVIYSGAGSTAWLFLVIVGVVTAPALLLGVVEDAGLRSLAAGVIGAVLAAASHAVLAATTTRDPQPTPEPVPLHRNHTD